MGTQVCIYDLHTRLNDAGYQATLNDWSNYDQYDIAVFMGFDHDMVTARKQNPHLRIALADPKLSKPEWIQAAQQADFLMVSSVEQRDVFWRLNRNILVYYMLPAKIKAIPKTHITKEPLIIGYHGNRVHLECMFEGLQLALSKWAEQRKIEFWAMYNLGLGQASIGIPNTKALKVRHIPWSWENYEQELAHTDIGVVPNLMPVRNRLHMLEQSAFSESEFMYQPFDHLIRFKASCNPGRIYPFAQYGIPVVSDFTPSSSQFISDGESGFLVSSPNGWFEALDLLAESPELRNTMAHNLRATTTKIYETQTEQFLDFCKKPIKSHPIQFAQIPTAQDELARLSHYRKPGHKSLWARLKNRLITHSNT